MYIKEKLKHLNYQKTTPIQDGVFKHFKSNKHLVGLAPTGTGKTHAYLLPLLEAVKDIKDQLGAIILVPTNELVIQVHNMLKDTDDQLSVKAYYGGSDKKKEVEWLLKYQPQIIITTPKRLYEYLYEANAIKSQTVKYMVLDEADMMFDEDFLKMIDPILERMKHPKMLLFSASITKEMQPFITHYFGAYDFIDTSKSHTLKIEYALINIKNKNRLDMLLELIKHIRPYLSFIFVSKKEDQPAIFDALSAQGQNVCMLHSGMPVKKRKQIIEDIRKLKYQYVVTSDLAARGMDFKISHVIHYDLPNNLEFFMHRSGRTARMDDDGIVYTFMSVDDHRKIEKLKKQGIPFKAYELSFKGITHQPKKAAFISEAELDAMKKIKKPQRVKPNYKKKNKALVQKAIKKARRKANDQNR